MQNTCNAWPISTPQPAVQASATADIKPNPKLDEEAATITALKQCLAMDGSLNQQPRLIDAYNYQPDLDNLPKNMDEAAQEKVMFYIQGRPDIPDFGFLIANIWRVAKRDQRIKFDSIMSLQLAKKLGFTYGAMAFQGNCKPVMQGDITTSGNFEHASITMPLAFNDKQVQLTYILVKQSGYNWQIDDLLIDNAGVANYVEKNLAAEITNKGFNQVIKDICQSSKIDGLKCN